MCVCNVHQHKSIQGVGGLAYLIAYLLLTWSKGVLCHHHQWKYTRFNRICKFGYSSYQDSVRSMPLAWPFRKRGYRIQNNNCDTVNEATNLIWLLSEKVKFYVVNDSGQDYQCAPPSHRSLQTRPELQPESASTIEYCIPFRIIIRRQRPGLKLKALIGEEAGQPADLALGLWELCDTQHHNQFPSAGFQQEFYLYTFVTGSYII